MQKRLKMLTNGSIYSFPVKFLIDLPKTEGEKLLNVKPSSLRRGCNALEGGIIFDKPKAIYDI